MKLLFTSIFLFLLALGGCETDFSARVSKERAQNAINKWLRDYGLPDKTRGFDKGQEARVTVTKVYGYGSAPRDSYANLQLNGFKYWDANGQDQSYTGKALLTFRDVGNQKWVIVRLAFESDGGVISTEFFPAEKIEVD